MSRDVVTSYRDPHCTFSLIQINVRSIVALIKKAKIDQTMNHLKIHMCGITEDQYYIITIHHTMSMEDWLTFSNPLPFQI